MFGEKITKTISIDGMHCMHCAKKIEDTLKGIKEVKSVKVILEDKKAEVILKSEINDDILKEAIENLGYTVLEIIC
ncbi:MAG: heavy-metal-associated domain-containing protein [Clostridia bacterium]|nr:heavy-metal-associated domain-containing protein [Clostridia bacterium]